MNIIIEDHRLSGEGSNFNASPNHSGAFAQGKADTIIIHFTAGSSFQSSVDHLCRADAKASAHIVVGREGQITQLVPFNLIAWHAGKSQWQGRTGLNKYAIGIELDNAGELSKNEAGQFVSWFNREFQSSDVFQGVHRNQSKPSFWHAYSEVQIEKTFALCKLLCDAYDIKQVLGHEEISPTRKTDPGPAFPLDRLRESIRSDRADDGNEEVSETLHQVAASKLNVRGGPGSEFDPVSKPLAFATQVEVLERHGDWSKIAFTQSGWVSSRFLTK